MKGSFNGDFGSKMAVGVNLGRRICPILLQYLGKPYKFGRKPYLLYRKQYKANRSYYLVANVMQREIIMLE